MLTDERRDPARRRAAIYCRSDVHIDIQWIFHLIPILTNSRAYRRMDFAASIRLVSGAVLNDEGGGGSCRPYGRGCARLPAITMDDDTVVRPVQWKQK